MKRLVLWILAPAFFLVSSCTAATTAYGQEEILFLEVAPDLVPCVGEMAGRCIQVRSPGEKDWRTFYDPIDGFEHEAGVRYTLKVSRRDVAHPPADGSGYSYRLIQIIARDPASG